MPKPDHKPPLAAKVHKPHSHPAANECPACHFIGESTTLFVSPGNGEADHKFLVCRNCKSLRLE